jgi:tRNA(Ile)-lysidine synthase
MQTMSVQEGVVILRPLLEVSRSEIEDWLQQRDQKWCTDSTNLQEDAALRNLVRLRLMPLLENMNARARENLSGDIRRLEEAERLYDEAVSQALTSLVTADGSMDIARLKESVAPRTLLQEWLHPLGFNSKQISEIYEGLDGSSGSVWASPTHRLLRDRGRLLLQATMPPLSSDEQVMPLGGLFTALSGKRLLIRRQVVNPSTFVVPRDSSIACFDIEKLTFPLTIRPVREGDRMHPFGLDGTRLVSDMMTDKKLSLFEKERQLVVLSGEKIVWLVGQRVAADFEVDDHTLHVMTIHVL